MKKKVIENHKLIVCASTDTFCGGSDYYQILGLTPSATLDELKSAYIQLAKRHHPDTAVTSSTHSDNNTSVEFLKISEAWGVLSKPTLKSHYDSLRKTHLLRTLGTAPGFSSAIGNNIHEDISYIPTSFAAQRDNYQFSVKPRASSSWQQTGDKYKTAKWQKLTLNEQKVRFYQSCHP
jgi:DnaJ-class molecular chaperone